MEKNTPVNLDVYIEGDCGHEHKSSNFEVSEYERLQQEKTAREVATEIWTYFRVDQFPYLELYSGCLAVLVVWWCFLNIIEHLFGWPVVLWTLLFLILLVLIGYLIHKGIEGGFEKRILRRFRRNFPAEARILDF